MKGINSKTYLKLFVVCAGSLLTSVHTAVVTFKHHDEIKEVLKTKTFKNFLKLLKIYLPVIGTYAATSVADFLVLDEKKKHKKAEDDLLFYDSFSESYINCTENVMNEAISKLKNDYFTNGYYSLHSFYDYIGYHPNKQIEDKLWINPSFNESEFMSPTYFPCKADDMTCYLIIFPE